jgi:hypothetical protein
MDAHVHVYPAYRWPEAVRQLLARLDGPDDAITVGLLTESEGVHFLGDRLAARADARDGECGIAVGPDGESLLVSDGCRLGYLIAGRQFVTAERLEILALGRDLRHSDGRPVGETLERITASGAIPVVSWAPGKWWGARGERVRRLIETHAPEAFLLGDTAMRPAGFPLPSLMRLARRRGFRIIAGSDPLPFPGEERRLGSYGIALEAAFDPARPAESIRRALADPTAAWTRVGRRGAVFTCLTRWVLNECRRRRPSLRA